MKILRTRIELQEMLSEKRKTFKRLGFVPTMGALHSGHLSLIQASKKENELTVCSIFVNPTQFNDPHDLEIYPRPLEQDISLLEENQVDFLFLPSVTEIYPEKEEWHIDLEGLDMVFEGKSRPGHFQGVTQVVYRLFSLVRPDRAYFGQKDFQQLLVIRKMVSLFKLSVEICSCPIVREADGLAMSSRNIHLKGQVREEASLISRALFSSIENSRHFPVSETIAKAKEILKTGAQLETDYFSIVDATTLKEVSHWDECPILIALTAVRAGSTRLIDNQYLRPLNY